MGELIKLDDWRSALAELNEPFDVPHTSGDKSNSIEPITHIEAARKRRDTNQHIIAFSSYQSIENRLMGFDNILFMQLEKADTIDRDARGRLIPEEYRRRFSFVVPLRSEGYPSPPKCKPTEAALFDYVNERKVLDHELSLACYLVYRFNLDIAFMPVESRYLKDAKDIIEGNRLDRIEVIGDAKALCMQYIDDLLSGNDDEKKEQARILISTKERSKAYKQYVAAWDTFTKEFYARVKEDGFDRFNPVRIGCKKASTR